MKIQILATIMCLVLPMLAHSNIADSGQRDCYSLSLDGQSWSRTPQQLCVESSSDREYQFTLESGLSFNRQVIAVFNLDLLRKARCLNCNIATYGVSMPQNSIFNEISIDFNGRYEAGKESGTVSIGKNRFYYKK